MKPPIKEQTIEWYRKEHRRGRGYKEPPEGLEEILYMSSFIPPKLVLPNLADGFGDYLTDFEYDLEMEKKIFGAFAELPEPWPGFILPPVIERRFEAARATHPGKQTYLKTKQTTVVTRDWPSLTSLRPTTTESLGEWMRELGETGQFQALKDITRAQVEFYEALREGRELLRTTSLRNKLNRGPHDWQRVPIGIAAYLTVDDSGKFRVGLGRLAEALQGEDASRIRQCKMCHEIFWAGRKDQETCTRRCTNLFHTHARRYQTEEHRIAYKQRRYEREIAKEKKERREQRANIEVASPQNGAG